MKVVAVQMNTECELAANEMISGVEGSTAKVSVRSSVLLEVIVGNSPRKMLDHVI